MGTAALPAASVRTKITWATAFAAKASVEKVTDHKQASVTAEVSDRAQCLSWVKLSGSSYVGATFPTLLAWSKTYASSRSSQGGVSPAP